MINENPNQPNADGRKKNQNCKQKLLKSNSDLKKYMYFLDEKKTIY